MAATFRSRSALFGFRFLVVYFGAYCLDLIPPWTPLVQWTATHIFHTSAATLPNHSGDTTWNYVQVFCIAVLALAAAILWTAFARGQPDSARVRIAFRLWLRFWLASAMLTYGLLKVFPLQFPAPSPELLEMTFGQASPMGLLWRFMGQSAAYTMFAGSLETMAGVLLAFRRTTSLGAFVAVGVLSNVVALNFCYDVPVKLYSTHLFVMALILAAPDVVPLFRLFLQREPVSLAPDPPLFQSLRWRRLGTVMTALAVAGYSWTIVVTNLSARAADTPHKSEVLGSWRADSFELLDSAKAPIADPGARWRSFTMYPRAVIVQSSDASAGAEIYSLSTDAPPNTLLLTPIRASGVAQARLWLHYKMPAPDRLEFDGTDGARHLRGAFRRIDVASFPLNARGFHWINEYPFNR